MTQHNFSEHADAVSPDLNPEPAPDPIKEPAPTLPANDPLKDEPTRREPPVGDPPVKEPPPEETQESFADLLNAFEKSHSHKSAPGAAQLQGTVVSLSADQVFLDIGYKTEGVLARSAFPNHAEGIKAGDTFTVSVTGRNEEHYYELSRFKVTQVRDWSALESAFQQKLAVVGTVTAVVKGGLSVDVGVRAFMPASRSGTRDAIELEKLVGTEITCRITKLDVTDEDVVVDRRVVLEEQARALTQASRDDLQASIKEGDIATGTVRTLMPYGAFIDLGGIDGLIHVSEISAAKRINHPSDVLRTGQVVKAQVLAIDVEKRQIKLSMKQLIPTSIDEYIAEHKVGDPVSGRVIELSSTQVIVELGEGIRGTCGTCGAAGTGRAGGAPEAPTIAPETDAAPKVDLSNISSMLKDRWKGNTPAAAVKPEPLSVGQIRTFKVVKLDAESKKIEVELG